MFKNTSSKLMIILISFQIISTCTTGAISISKTNNNTDELISEQQIEDINQINVTFNSGKYKLYGEIYHPTNDTKTYPCIIFCEGYPAYVSAYSWIPKALAKQGYIVLIYDLPGLGRSEGFLPIIISITVPALNLFFRFGTFTETPIHYFLRDLQYAASDALTYLLNESPVKQLINNSSIGLIGHSLGGITATEVASKDKRFDTVIAMSHGNPLVIRKIDVPILFIYGDFDLGLYSIPLTLGCYKKANTPKEIIAIQGGTHFGFTTTFKSLCPCPSWQKGIIKRYTVGWFDHFLKNKNTGYVNITTGTDHLSKIFKSKYDFGDGEHIIS